MPLFASGFESENAKGTLSFRGDIIDSVHEIHSFFTGYHTGTLRRMALERVSSRKFARINRSSEKKISACLNLSDSKVLSTIDLENGGVKRTGDEGELINDKATPALTSQCHKATTKTTGHSHCSIPTCLGRTRCAQETMKTEQVG